jgi:protein-tyrosine phosphatase
MKVLMVCLGNICRSPIAEGILQHKIDTENLSMSVDSAGTSNYHIDEAPDPRAIAVARKNGIDISSLRGRQFVVEDFDLFDIIFVMDYSNYENVIRLANSEADKEKVKLILNQIYPNENQSVPDPYFGGDDGFDDVFKMLNASISNFTKSQS